jgi:prophage antirepressor-like protein
MNLIIPFAYGNSEVRVIEMHGEPWFVASDVARVLGYANISRDVQRHCKSVREINAGEGGTETVLSSIGHGGARRLLIIPERDVYRLIMRSKLPAAERFEEWVVGEVLPAIRRYGQYTPIVPQTLADALQLAADQQREIDAQQALIAEAKPKVEFFDAVASSKDAIEMKHVAKALGSIGRNRLFEFLRNQGVLMQDNTPYQTYVDRGYFRLVEQKYTTPDGETHIRFKTLVYQKGVNWIRKQLEKHEIIQPVASVGVTHGK